MAGLLPGPPARQDAFCGPCSPGAGRGGGDEDPGQAREIQGHRWKCLLSNAKALPSVLTTSRRKCPFSTNVSLILVISFKEQE